MIGATIILTILLLFVLYDDNHTTPKY